MAFRLALFSSAYYAANAVYQGFISVYLAGQGLSTGQIGLVMGAVPLLSILTQPAWGALNDRARRQGVVLCLMALFSAMLLWLLPLGRSFLWLLAANSLFAACFTALSPMGDALVLSALGKGGGYGKVRLWASLSFALASMAAGFLFKGRMALLVPLGSALLLAAAGAALLVPPVSGGRAARYKGMQLVKVPGLMPRILLSGVLQATMGYFYSFFPVRFLQLPGSDAGKLGLCYLIGSLSEIPFLFLFDRLFARLGAGRLLAGSALFLCARYLALGAGQSPLVMMATQVLSGVGIIALTATMAREVARLVPHGLGARGQALYSAVSYGLSRVAGNLLGALAAQRLGVEAGFFLMAALALAAGLGFVALIRGAVPPDSCSANN